MKIAIEDLKQTTRQAILKSGYTESEAEIILDVILYAQLRGNNQGVIKLVGAGMPKESIAGDVSIVKETKLSVLYDGGFNQGMVVMMQAMRSAILKAKEHGFGIAATRRTRSSTGAIGYYVRRIAQEGLIGITMSSSSEFMAMHGSYEGFFGTNPIAFGIPSAENPIVFDMATASMAYYGIVEANTAGLELPHGVAYNSTGEITTDASEALSGAIRAFGGHKGAALALMVELLTRPLLGASRKADGTKEDWGNLIMAIDPELFGDVDSFKAEVSDLIKRLKNTKKLPDVDEILVPGERGDRFYSAVMAAGEIELDDNLWSGLQAVANR